MTMAVLRRKNRRKKPLKQRMVEVGRSTWTAVQVVTKAALTVALILTLPVGIYSGYHALMRSDYFVVSSIRVTGNERVSRQEILVLSGLDRTRNLLSLDIEEMATRIEANPWIMSAELQRELPRTLTIEVRERESKGWLFFDRLYHVDAEGLIIEEGLASQVNGPLITGIEPIAVEEDGGGQAARVRRALALIDLYRDRGLDEVDVLAEVHFDELLGFSLLTRDQAMEIRIGDDRFDERLDRLMDVYSTLALDHLQGRYILLDGDDDLMRVAVGPDRPGRDGSGTGGVD